MLAGRTLSGVCVCVLIFSTIAAVVILDKNALYSDREGTDSHYCNILNSCQIDVKITFYNLFIYVVVLISVIK